MAPTMKLPSGITLKKSKTSRSTLVNQDAEHNNIGKKPQVPTILALHQDEKVNVSHNFSLNDEINGMDPEDVHIKSEYFNCNKCSKKYCDGARHRSMFTCPTCHRCGANLQALYNFCLRIEGFDKKFLCIRCSEKVERKFLTESEEEDNELEFIQDDQYSYVEIEVKQETTMLEIEKVTSRGARFAEEGVSSDSSVTFSHNKYKCKLCPETFNTTKRLEGHLAKDHERSTVKCRICDNLFNTTEIRNFHENRKHKNSSSTLFQCPLCSKEIKDIVNMETHINLHKGKVSHTCEICGKGFAGKPALYNHMRSHNTQKKFLCVLCSKGFRYKHALYRHMQRHTDERPFACDLCEKTYRDMSDLRRHKYSHGGYEKKFKCLVCEKTFYENKSLKYHLRTHQNNSNVITTKIKSE